ncbi:hypothetical protein MsAg5_12550 [Methanosarcinaceae archaeon Ag5]|uniref:Uncharacterized protein n=1 Tax=Methanolapillus africanus TaxID=3028297 RepID=A0AAE4SE33_9EURY|nr:hypothetical protein [Methanosarcinaceae archaeon Ag5]
MTPEQKDYTIILSVFLILFILIFLYYDVYLGIGQDSAFLMIPLFLLPAILCRKNVSILWKCGTIALSMGVVVFYFMGSDWYPDFQLAVGLLCLIYLTVFTIYEGWYRKKFKMLGW